MRILSTKKLSLSQTELILNAGVSLVAYDAIHIEFLDESAPSKIENAIITSQNAVRAIEKLKIEIINCFCVGEKTKARLIENGIKVVKMANNSTELGLFIAKNHPNKSFCYFSGSERRDELPDLLTSSKIDFFEVKTYKTTLKPRKFDQKWDGILFFSPSGVTSFVAENSIEPSIAFCIGETTAAEAKKYGRNIVVANTTSIESVIAKAVKTLRNK